MLSALEIAGKAISAGSGMAEDLSGDALAVYSVYLASFVAQISPAYLALLDNRYTASWKLQREVVIT